MLRLFCAGVLTALVVTIDALAAGAQTTTVPAPASGASPAPLATPANPPENPLVTARVTKEFSAWQSGRIDRKMYSPYAGGTYIDALVAVIEPDLVAIGTPQTTTYKTAALLLNDLVYRYEISGPNGTMSVLYALDQAGKTDAITFTPLIFRSASPTP